MITVVVLNYNDYNTTKTYIKKIRYYECVQHIVVVDNCSTDSSYEKLLELKDDKVDIIKSERNGGYGYGNNYGIKYAHNKYGSQFILVSNPDVEYDEDSLIALENKIRSDLDIAVVSATMKNADGQISPISSWRLPSGWNLIFATYSPYTRFAKTYYYQNIDYSMTERDVGAVAGSMLLVNYDHLARADFYDEDIFLYMEETVLGLKLRKQNSKTVILNDVFFTHYHGISISKTVKSNQDHLKLMWNSTKIVLKKYYKFNALKLFVVNILRIINLSYCKIKSKLRK